MFPRPLPTLLLLGIGALASCQPDGARPDQAGVPEQPAPVRDAPRPPHPRESSTSPSAQRVDTFEFATHPPGKSAYEAYLKADTLLAVTPDRAVEYPLGEGATAAALTTRYPLLAVHPGVSYYQGDTLPYTVLRFRNSAVKFYDDSEWGATVVSGHVVDPEIVLVNGVHIGTTLSELLRAYYVTVPTEKLRTIRIVRVDYAVNGIIYYYSLENNRVVRLDLDSYSVIDKSL
ncbi:hypothetical protein I2I05_20860 [Hymenobacter sp. BT683]|uniref:Beta-lactamase-inhibitor-like PepSY-like domain-containing protein n=1 Tax=Hymenobacter jeongseonensis TaxID=2791027 RepID=A0ABS0INC1_9BACT|nr:hypothetical protein [Hymenobacter jeongseonensis]MBF9239856.1 hypothetical protein [Hymenobacter jeongseonensis]